MVVTRSVLARLDKAMQAFFPRVRAGGAPGFPRFRARSRYRSFSVDDPVRAQGAVRIGADGRSGAIRMKGLPVILFQVKRILPAMDTSQCCSDCGTCGLELCGDLNAARNVLERALHAGGWELSCCTPRHVEPGMEDLACQAVPGCRTVYGCSSPGGSQLKYIIPRTTMRGWSSKHSTAIRKRARKTVRGTGSAAFPERFEHAVQRL